MLRLSGAVDSVVQKPKRDLTEKDLVNGRMVEVFQEAVERVFAKAKLHPSLAAP